jgi:hypothetical protein
MPLPRPVHDYLRKRAATAPWHIEGTARRNYRGAIVIPALAESESLFATLDSLQSGPAALRDEFLLLVVVNHRRNASASEVTDNLCTLRKLATAAETLPHLGWVDAASPGRELPDKTGGVGLARKIGLDMALQRLDWAQTPILANLDADTLVRADYLTALCAHFANSQPGAAVVPFCHRPADDPQQQRGIDAYELYQRGHVLGLQLAGSPYAFHTVGSTMACRALDYVRAGGMNRRQAGEDFYFLQQLAKITGVRRVPGTVVYPSARFSRRTPFGTGRSVAQLAADTAPPRLYYDPRCYAVLNDWLRLAAQDTRENPAELLVRAAGIHEQLVEFLRLEGIEAVWPRLYRNHRDQSNRLAALHGWFDGLKSTRLIHHLTRTVWPRQTAARALPPLMLRAGYPAPVDAESQLAVLRNHQIGPACTDCGLPVTSTCCRVPR